MHGDNINTCWYSAQGEYKCFKNRVPDLITPQYYKFMKDERGRENFSHHELRPAYINDKAKGQSVKERLINSYIGQEGLVIPASEYEIKGIEKPGRF